MDKGLALHQQISIPLRLLHQYGQVLIKFCNAIPIFLPLLDVLSIGTFSLPRSVSLVPQFIALIAKLALTYAFHMRASDLLLDWLLALRTLSSVILYPGRVGLL